MQVPPTSLESWKIVQEESVFHAPPWLKVVRQTLLLPGGITIPDYFQIEQRDYCEIVAVDHQQRFLGFWRYKHGPRCVNLGLPAGYIEVGEDPLAAAKRELLEETGLEAANWQHIGAFFVDGNRTSTRAWLYLATQLQRAVVPAVSDDLEEMHPTWVSIDEIPQLISSGQACTLGVVTALSIAYAQKIANKSDEPAIHQ
ncbi:MAG: NUDIX hydrolase [Zavarzinella sp.]